MDRKFNPESVNDTLTHWGRALGLPGVGGICILVFCIAFYVSVIEPGFYKIKSLRKEAEHLRAMSVIKPSASLPPIKQLEHFDAFFPPFKQAPQVLLTIFEIAKHHKIILEQGKYKLVVDPDLRLLRYQMSFPLTGSYVQIRAFIFDVLHTVPAASLDFLNITKDSPHANAVEAQIQFTLFLLAKQS